MPPSSVKYVYSAIGENNLLKKTLCFFSYNVVDNKQVIGVVAFAFFKKVFQAYFGQFGQLLSHHSHHVDMPSNFCKKTPFIATIATRQN